MRGAAQALPDLLVLALVRLVACELQGEVVAAGAEKIPESLEAWLDGVTLPARDLGAVAADALAEVSLRDAGEKTGLTDEHAAGHGLNLLVRVAIIKRIIYVPFVASQQLSLDQTAAPTPEPNGKPKSALPRVTVMPNEAASMLGVSRDFFDEHIKPELRIIRRGSKTIMIPVFELERWVDESAARYYA